jgi:hypothetical protein
MKQRSRSEWIALIEDTAYGRVSWNSIADCSPWDSFYRDYRATSVQCRQEINDAFLVLLESMDPRVMTEAIRHTYYVPATVAVMRLLRLLEERSAFLLAHRSWDSDRSLLASVLNALAAGAESCGSDFSGPRVGMPLKERVRDTILHWVPKAGGLQGGSMGTFFGELGPEAADALAAVLPAELENARLIVDVGYELHRSPEQWARAIDLAARWPQVWRDALELGGANHAARTAGQ